jgi:hypothetical protein
LFSNQRLAEEAMQLMDCSFDDESGGDEIRAEVSYVDIEDVGLGPRVWPRTALKSVFGRRAVPRGACQN